MKFISVRLPAELYARLKEKLDKNGQKINPVLVILVEMFLKWEK